MSNDKDLEDLQDKVTQELAAVIGDFANDEKGSEVRDLQPPESVIELMAVAAASVLIAFERGYRMSE